MQGLFAYQQGLHSHDEVPSRRCPARHAEQAFLYNPCNARVVRLGSRCAEMDRASASITGILARLVLQGLQYNAFHDGALGPPSGTVRNPCCTTLAIEGLLAWRGQRRESPGQGRTRGRTEHKPCKHRVARLATLVIVSFRNREAPRAGSWGELSARGALGTVPAGVGEWSNRHGWTPVLDCGSPHPGGRGCLTEANFNQHGVRSSGEGHAFDSQESPGRFRRDPHPYGPRGSDVDNRASPRFTRNAAGSRRHPAVASSPRHQSRRGLR